MRFPSLLAVAALVSAFMSCAQKAPPKLPKPDPPNPKPATSQLQVSFTFDDLPAHAPIPRITSRVAIAQSVLDTLHRENLPPVYGFVNGQKVALQPRWLHILKMWHAAGEPMGNHTWSHPEFDALTVAQYEKEITRNEPILKQVDPDGDWHWFRFPYLEEGATVQKREALRSFLKAHGYRIAEISLDFQDYLWNDPYQRCMDKHRAADVQWLHDSYLAAASQAIAYGRTLTQRAYGRDIPYVLLLHLGAFDAKMLPELIALFRSQGFAFVTLPQAQSDPAYNDDPAVGAKGGGMLEEFDAAASAHRVGFPDNPSPEQKLDHLCR